jgi:hypothetical protein
MDPVWIRYGSGALAWKRQFIAGEFNQQMLTVLVECTSEATSSE